MSKYNFDEVIERKGTNCLKFDTLHERFGDANLIPLWVADMDFKSPPEITDAIVKLAEHGLYGYPTVCPSYYHSVRNWLAKQHNWEVEEEWIGFIPGIVKGISFVIDCFMHEGEKVIIQPPVYPPFRSIPAMYSYKIVENPLVLEAGKFSMDIDNLREAITPGCRVLILCNPHNPGGTVWTKQELIDLAEICYEEGILVISDEIHCDLTLQDNQHIPFATVSEKAAQNSITFMAPSKTFNIAGIVSSYAIIPNKLLRETFNKYLEKRELSSPHIFATVATIAAYDHGAEWLEELKVYLWKNIQYVDKYLKENIPQIKALIPDSSFLIWLDCRELGLNQEDLVKLFITDAHLALNDGSTFGKQGEGFMRLNIGTTLSVLEQSMENLKKAVIAKQL